VSSAFQAGILLRYRIALCRGLNCASIRTLNGAPSSFCVEMFAESRCHAELADGKLKSGRTSGRKHNTAPARAEIMSSSA